MELRIFKKFYIFIMLALFAGIIFLSCGFSSTVPKGVKVDGTEVGGLTYREAAGVLRGEKINFLKQNSLLIHADADYEYTYPEINFKDDIYGILKSARRGDDLQSQTSYYLCCIDDIVGGIAASARTPLVEPYAEFKASNAPFVYHAGRDGREIDTVKLKRDIIESLKGGFEPVNAAYVGVKRTKSLEEVKKNTVLLSRFTTHFDGDNLARSSNIRLAAAKLNGRILNGKKTLSFNDTVGARVKSRGFLPAKIIENGEFTEGVGGGVCQVSTTLYNAALLSGLKIAEYHPHSLAVSYVPPSRDAMVSGTVCDLKITNNYDCPVYICSRTGKDYVTFEIYGRFAGQTYSISSEVTGSVPAPEEECKDKSKAREGKDGILSESYLVVNNGGYKKTVFLRKDKYSPVKRLVYKGEECVTGEENL